MLVRLTADLDVEAVAQLLDRCGTLDVCVPADRPVYAEALWHRLQFQHGQRFCLELPAGGYLNELWALVVLGGVQVVFNEELPGLNPLPSTAIGASAATLAELEACCD